MKKYEIFQENMSSYRLSKKEMDIIENISEYEKTYEKFQENMSSYTLSAREMEILQEAEKIKAKQLKNEARNRRSSYNWDAIEEEIKNRKIPIEILDEEIISLEKEHKKILEDLECINEAQSILIFSNKVHLKEFDMNPCSLSDNLLEVLIISKSIVFSIQETKKKYYDDQKCIRDASQKRIDDAKYRRSKLFNAMESYQSTFMKYCNHDKLDKNFRCCLCGERGCFA